MRNFKFQNYFQPFPNRMKVKYVLLSILIQVMKISLRKFQVEFYNTLKQTLILINLITTLVY